MKIVGEKLESWALEQKAVDDKDLFGRSAFNRYYYAIFLLTREMLGEFKKSWKGTMHASIPDLLRTSVKKEVNKTLKSAIRNGLISQGESSQIIHQHNISLNALANLLEEAYQVRKIADYEPEITIQQKRNVLSLDRHKLTSAKTWPDRAASYCKVIRKVWKEVGLA
ncbi:MAG: hypothetical protein N0C84_10455 [Candidatus Thiodiazotropha taylori]|uniref:Uncharacterized protein n=1 Tax=Candidatus Thiodiazotropha taylori TaxID=2792791 RepID=A0A9E4N4V8_9GAMM|nr:hypothetical protein [Candidatus Thiodiazotropha taylori]MCW4256871.1 hypothetical protein [Candidatus Thiodiazotropha taylori]